MIRIAENILRKNWGFTSGNSTVRPILSTEIPGGFRIENVNQNLLSGYFYPQSKINKVTPFPLWVSMTLRCSISTRVRVAVEGTPIVSNFNLVAQEASEVLMVDTVSELTRDALSITLQINDLPVGEWIEITDTHLFLSTEKPDIWTPAHADLTPEQVSLMKYGEFTEITSV